MGLSAAVCRIEPGCDSELVGRAKLAVACVAEARHDECMLVEVAVDRRCHDVQIHSGGFQVFDALRCSQHARNEDGRTGAAIDEDLAAVGK